MAGSNVRGDTGFVVVVGDDFNGLNGKGLGGVLGKHGDQLVDNNLDLSLVGTGEIKENVSGVQGDLCAVTVDDGGHGKDVAISIVESRVDRRVTDDVKVLSKILVLFVKFHDFGTGHFFGLIQGNKLDILGVSSLVCDGGLDKIQIVSAHSDQRAVSADICVEFILQGNEGVVFALVKLDSTENSASNVLTDLSSLRLNSDLNEFLGVSESVLRKLLSAQENVEGTGNTLKAQHVISVCRDFNFQLGALTGSQFTFRGLPS